MVDTVNAQIEELKAQANSVNNEYMKICMEESLEEQGLKSAKMSVRFNLGFSPDEPIITGGVISSNAAESHLIGRQKTQEELAFEREDALAEIRTRVANKQITLAQASKLKNDVDIAYGYTEPIQAMDNNMNK